MWGFDDVEFKCSQILGLVRSDEVGVKGRKCEGLMMVKALCSSSNNN